MKREVLFLSIGIAVGGLAVSAAQSYLRTSPDVQRESDQSFNSVADSQPGDPLSSPAIETIPDGQQSTASILTEDAPGAANGSAPVATVTERTDFSPLTQMPEPYHSMVKPKEFPKVYRTPELYDRFQNDTRDNSWADAMEAGIGQFIAHKGSELEAAFDFVECRSRYCTIAGVAYGNDPRPWNTINNALTGSGWWSASGGTSTISNNHGEETRFVSIFSRDASDTLRPVPTDSDSNKLTESKSQAVQVAQELKKG